MNFYLNPVRIIPIHNSPLTSLSFHGLLRAACIEEEALTTGNTTLYHRLSTGLNGLIEDHPMHGT